MKSEVQVQLGAAAIIWGEDVRLQVISSSNRYLLFPTEWCRITPGVCQMNSAHITLKIVIICLRGALVKM